MLASPCRRSAQDPGAVLAAARPKTVAARRRQGRVLAATSSAARDAAALSTPRRWTATPCAADARPAAPPAGGRRSGRRRAPSMAADPARPCASSPARRCRDGADAIVIQEDVTRTATRITVSGTPMSAPTAHPRGRAATSPPALRVTAPRARPRDVALPRGDERWPSRRRAARWSASSRPATNW